MEWWQAVILGLVEGITEYLPVSSTGHLIIASSLLDLDAPDQKAALDTYLIIIQGGAILAVLGLYWPRVLRMIRGVFGRDPGGLKLAINLFIAFLPAAMLGPILHEEITARLFNVPMVLAALFVGGIWMIWLGRGKKHHVNLDSHEDGSPADQKHAQLTIEDMTWRTALAIGLFQVVAMWPGTSRSMMTIAGGTLLGLKPKEAAEFSFLLGLPTLGGAFVYSLGKDYMASESGLTIFNDLGAPAVIIGVIVATISAAIAVKWLVAFLNTHGLAAFGWYRIALCALFGGLALAGLVNVTPS